MCSNVFYLFFNVRGVLLSDHKLIVFVHCLVFFMYPLVQPFFKAACMNHEILTFLHFAGSFSSETSFY